MVSLGDFGATAGAVRGGGLPPQNAA